MRRFSDSTHRHSTGAVGLWPVMTLLAFVGGLSAAASAAHTSGESAIFTAAGLLVGFFAGLITYFAFSKAGTRLSERSPYLPERVPTFREELPFMLLYLGAVIGIVASINIACWLVRVVLRNAFA